MGGVVPGDVAAPVAAGGGAAEENTQGFSGTSRFFFARGRDGWVYGVGGVGVVEQS